MNSMQEAFENTQNKRAKQLFLEIKKTNFNRNKKIASIKKKIRTEIKRYEQLIPLISRMFLEFKEDQKGYNQVLPYVRNFCKKADPDQFTYLVWDLEEVPKFWQFYTAEKIYKKLGMPV